MNARVPAHELRLYRSLTFNLLRRYFRLALSLGRLPSLVGREFFRTQYQLQHHTFEDSVIFVHDMERCLKRLDPVAQQMISLIVFQDFSWEQTARLLNFPRRSLNRRFPAALDFLTKVMLRVGLIQPFSCHPDPPRSVILSGAEAAAAAEGEVEGSRSGQPAWERQEIHSPEGATETCQEPKNVKIEGSY